ncbi:AIPR family protein [Parasphingorhabdus sp.]|uniref:AIPR family protein n=1 Tax=Parasphingorhabdus sp. TaxID=2709688 RepID=UPI003A8E68E2
MFVTPNQTWQAAYQSTRDSFGLANDAIGVFAVQLRFNLDDIKNLAAESITGGGNDRKCDVLYIDRETGVAVVAQCYVAQTKKPAAKSDKAADLNTAISWLLSAPIDTLDQSLRGRAEDLRDALQSDKINQLHIWYVHNLPASKNVEKELKTVEETAINALANYGSGSDINVFAKEIDTNELESLYTKAERTIIVVDTFEVTVPDVIEHKEDRWSSISTFVPGRWLQKLYSDHGTDLFSANLRSYLGSRSSEKNINNGIKQTAIDEPENFLVYNNGVTSLVLNYEYGRKTKKGRKLSITGVSIVNGAQTTGSIANSNEEIDEKLMVGIRFVKAESDDLIEKIVKFNNSQNKLEAADFRSNDAIQDRLRIEFTRIPDAEYEGGRRGGASDAIKRSKYTLPSYTVGQSLTAFHGEPVIAYNSKSDIWINDKLYSKVFTERTTARHISFCYSILEAINNKRLNLLEKSKSEDESLTEQEKSTLKYLDKKGSHYLLIYVVAQCLETILGRSIPNKFDIKFKKNASPFELANEWEKILDILLPLANQLDDAFAKGRITNEGVAKSLTKFTAVFAAVANLQETAFSQFASKIQLD